MDEFYSVETVFFKQICHYPETWWNHHVAALFEISVLKEAFCVFHLHNNLTMMLIPKVQNKASAS